MSSRKPTFGQRVRFAWNAIKAGFTLNFLPRPAEDDPDFFTYSTFGSDTGWNRSARGLEAVPAAYAAINIKTDQLAIQRRAVMDADNVELPLHPITALLRMPSRIVDPVLFWRIIKRAYNTHGNAYCWIRRDFRTNQPIELVPAICLNTRVEDARRSPYYIYRLQLLGSNTGGPLAFSRQVEVRGRDVLAFHGPGFDGLSSPSPIRYAARATLQLMRQSTEHQQSSLENGMSSGNVLQINPELADTIGNDRWKELGKLLEEGYAGARNAGKTPFLPPAVQLAKATMISAVDLQLIDLLKWGVEDMARVFGISPFRLGHYQQGYRVMSFEMQSADFERYTAAPDAAVFDSQMNYKLLTPEEIMASLTIRTDTNTISMGSLSERAKIALDLVANGGMWQIDEGRHLTGQRPLPDGKGQKVLQPKGAPPQNDETSAGTDNSENSNAD